MQTVTTEELLAEPVIDLTAPEETETIGEQSHIVPEIQIRKKFFEATAGKDYLTLKLAANGVRVESADLSISKNLSYQGLVKSLSNQASLDTGLLPLLGDSYIAVRRYMIFKNKHFVFIEASPKKREIIFAEGNSDSEKKYKIPFPGLLLCVIMQEDANGRLFFQKDASKMFALAAPIINDKIDIYRYPFTNVYDDNRICWGDTLSYLSNKRYEMTVQQAAGLVDIFLTGVNNRDLWNARYNHLRAAGDFAGINKVFKDLETKTSYPSDTLVKVMTFNGIVSQLTQN